MNFHFPTPPTPRPRGPGGFFSRFALWFVVGFFIRWARLLLACFFFCYRPNSSLRRVAASTAAINAPRTARFSNSAIPAIVVPPGLATASFNSPGCRPVSNTIFAAPKPVWAANFVATARGKPTFTPPSLNA